MAGTWLTQRDRDRIWELFGEGKNANEISHAVGRAYSTVAMLLKTTGGVRPGVRHRSTRHLSLAEREEISRGLHAKETYACIATRLHRSVSTVSREVARNGGREHYRALRADRRALEEAGRPKAAKLTADPALRALVEEKLRCHWSPQQIAAWLRQTYPDAPDRWISHESIYTSLFKQVSGLSTDLHQHLRSGRDRRRPRKRRGGERRGKNPSMVLITQRPSHVEDRQEPGHWEGDLIMGRGHRRAIGTLVERVSRYVFLIDFIDGYDAETMSQELVRHLGELPEHLRRTLTWDQGTEMSDHEAFSATSGIDVYFCYPHSPWQRGTNENTNGLLRQYFPKGVDLAGTPSSRLVSVADELNARPRRVLEWQTPAQRFDLLLR